MSARRDAAAWIAVAIGAVMAVGGVSESVLPRMVLRLVAAPQTPELGLLVSLVGAMTALTGAAMLPAALAQPPNRSLLAWTAAVKLCAPALLACGIVRGLVGGAAPFVAGYDLLTGAFVLWYGLQRPRPPAQPAGATAAREPIPVGSVFSG